MLYLLSVGDNKPIWMQAEEREENKVCTFYFTCYIFYFLRAHLGYDHIVGGFKSPYVTWKVESSIPVGAY